MKMDFAKGIKIKTIHTQYGDILKVGIDTEKIEENPLNGAWCNIEIKKSKSGDWYQCLSENKKS